MESEKGLKFRGVFLHICFLESLDILSICRQQPNFSGPFITSKISNVAFFSSSSSFIIPASSRPSTTHTIVHRYIISYALRPSFATTTRGCHLLQTTKQHPSMVETLPIASPNDLLRTPPRTHHKNYPAGTMKIGERLDTVAVTPLINFMTIFAAHRDLNVPTLHPHVFSHSSANIILQKSPYVPCPRHLRRVPPRSSASSCSKIGPTTVFFPADARRSWPKR